MTVLHVLAHLCEHEGLTPGAGRAVWKGVTCVLSSLFWSRLQTASHKVVGGGGVVHLRHYSDPFQANLQCLVPVECYLMSWLCALS